MRLLLALMLMPTTALAVDLIMRSGGEECVATFAPGSVVETYPDRWEAVVVELPDCGPVIIDPPPNDGPCEVLPVGLERDARFKYFLGNDFSNRFATTYEDAFGPWPLAAEAQGRSYRIQVPRKTFISMPFSVPAVGGPDDEVRFGWTESLAPSESTVVSVSTCEGGVIESQALPDCWERGTRISGSITIGVNPAKSRCVVERGRSYWLNIADYYETTGESTCGEDVCELLLRPLAVGAVE